MLERRRKLSHPHLDPLDGKRGKEHGEKPFRQRFQQSAILRRCDLDNPIGHLRIIDRLADVIRRRCRLSLALQFQVDRQGLRPPALLRRHAAASLKLQPLDDDLPSHGSHSQGLDCGLSIERRGEGARPGGFLARRTRTIKLCSSDARSEGRSGCSP